MGYQSQRLSQVVVRKPLVETELLSDSSDLRYFNEVITELHQTVTDLHAWQGVLLAMVSAVQGKCGVLRLYRAKSDPSPVEWHAHANRMEHQLLRDLDAGDVFDQVHDNALSHISMRPLLEGACMTAVRLIHPQGAGFLLRIYTKQASLHGSQSGMLKLILPHMEWALENFLRAHSRRLVEGAFSTVTESLGLAAFVLDPQGRVLEVNPSASRLLRGKAGLELTSDRKLRFVNAEDARQFKRLLPGISTDRVSQDHLTRAFRMQHQGYSQNAAVVVKISPQTPDAYRISGGGDYRVCEPGREGKAQCLSGDHQKSVWSDVQRILRRGLSRQRLHAIEYGAETGRKRQHRSLPHENYLSEERMQQAVRTRCRGVGQFRRSQSGKKNRCAVAS